MTLLENVAARVVASLPVSVVALAMVGCAAAPPGPPTEPTRIIWNNPRDPQLARFQETSASCRDEAAAKYAVPESGGGSRRLDSQRQQYWFACMKTRGYVPREVSAQ